MKKFLAITLILCLLTIFSTDAKFSNNRDTGNLELNRIFKKTFNRFSNLKQTSKNFAKKSKNSNSKTDDELINSLVAKHSKYSDFTRSFTENILKFFL